MAAGAVATRAATSTSTRIVIGAGVLLVVFILSGLLLAYSYWLGISFFFVGLLGLIRFGFEEYQGRNLLLLGVFSLLVAILVGSLTQVFLIANPGISPFAQDNPFTIFLTSIVVGVVASLIGVIIPFLVLVAITTVGILKWHKIGEPISFIAAYWYLLITILGVFRFSVIIEDGDKKGSERDIQRLEQFGGPGWLIIHAGQVVVLREWGKITRVAGLGSFMLRRNEQIKAIVPLTPKGNMQEIENVLTRDKVPLTVKVVHVAQMEPAAQTAERLGTAIDDDHFTIGDDYDECYDSIARRVATKAPNVWESMKATVASNIKDVFITCNFEELFDISGENEDLEGSINNRKIAEIEETVLERSRGSATGKGLILRAVDINEVIFPEEITDKINKEVTALMDARIKQTQARTRELEAESEETAARFRARAMLELATADAQAEVLRGRAKAEARSEYYRRIFEVVADQPDQVANTILQNIATSTVLEDDLERLLELMVHYIHGEHTGKASAKSQLDQD
jgi:regulator of protease activity HflC (stomatin/prohibitin superfamily)